MIEVYTGLCSGLTSRIPINTPSPYKQVHELADEGLSPSFY